MEENIRFVSDSSKRLHFDNFYINRPQRYGEIILYQIGDLFCEGGCTIDEHVQACYEISYIVSGKGTFFTNGKAYPVKAGEIYFCLPGEVHSGIADKAEPYRFFYLGFDFENNDNRLYTDVKQALDGIKQPVVQNMTMIEPFFLNAFEEILQERKHGNTMLKTYLQQIFVMIYRSIMGSQNYLYHPEKNIDYSNQIIYKIINYLECNLHSIENLTVIAEELGYSYSYLSHLFTKRMGMSIQQYYNKKRFEQTAHLLKDGRLTITQISQKFQYQNVNSFCKAFRKYYGVSPTAYRTMHQERINTF